MMDWKDGCWKIAIAAERGFSIFGFVWLSRDGNRCNAI